MRPYESFYKQKVAEELKELLKISEERIKEIKIQLEAKNGT